MERKVAFYPNYIHITNTNKSNILFFEYRIVFTDIWQKALIIKEV